MAIRKKYKRGTSTQGYKKTSPDKDNSSNLIPSNSITMKGVDKSIIGIGLGTEGEMTSMKFMKPEEEHSFREAYAVLEVPNFQAGGIQYAEESGSKARFNIGSFPDQYGDFGGFSSPADENYNGNPKPYSNEYPQSAPTFANNFLTTQEKFTNDYMESLTASQKPVIPSAEGQPLPESSAPEEDYLDFSSAQVPSQVDSSVNLDEIFSQKPLNPANESQEAISASAQNKANESLNKQGLNSTQIENPEKTQLFNPYGGVDIPTATSMLGASVERGDVGGSLLAGVKVGTGLARNFFGGMGTQRRNDFVEDEYNKGQRDKLTQASYQNGGQPKMLKSGGELTQEEVLSGQFSGENSEQPNAEVEKGEYLKAEGNQVSEIKGETHEKGGVAIDLKEGEKVLSDHTKIGGDTAKMIRDNFEIEVKAKDTYSTIIDKFTSKSGLKKLYEEQEELMSKVSKETEKDDSPTKEVNLQFLSKKINELEEKKKPLEEAKKMLFDKAYSLQEEAKPKSEQVQETFQIGGQRYNSDQITEYAKNYGISPEKAVEMVKKFQSGGSFGTNGETSGFPEGQHRDPETGLYGDVTPQMLSETMLRNPWFNWDNFDPKNPEDVRRFQSEFKSRSTTGKYPKVDSKFGEQTQTAQLPYDNTLPITPVGSSDITGGLPGKQYAGEWGGPSGEGLPEGTDPSRQGNNGEGANIVPLPSQETLLPSTLQPVLKAERRYGRIDPTMVDPSQAISQVNVAQQSAEAALNERPDASRSAALAQVAANTQDSVSKNISQANLANQKAQQQADAFNVRQGDMEVNANAADALSYEQRMLQGMTNTENDFRDYFQTQQNTHMTNFKTIEELNYMNAVNDKFQYDGSGFKQIGQGDSVEDMLKKVKFNQATQNKLKWGGKKR
ncbi:structural protein [Cellulophaga phage phi17:2_18]|uniref:Structural protein n=2 Tax=Lightbulbvirus Cba172 TaxID=1918525 RepID=R9ZWK2_9CAUD|nr:virion structural protein [Cellulophaga phage phi17:2]AGO47574.1 structural protein [Cellulophaga phage phi17:2]ALO80444.1 structural protein [Cellulophaga phage phi17:2_18]